MPTKKTSQILWSNIVTETGYTLRNDLVLETTISTPDVATTPVEIPSTSALIEMQLLFNGKTYNFNSGQGTELEVFNSTYGFNQRNIRYDISELNMTVFFRPDVDGKRTEVVVELGRCFGVANAVAKHMGAYSVTLSSAGIQLAKIDIPQHFWQSRWRWQSSPRPVVKSIEDLIAQKLIPPYKRALRTSGTKIPLPFVPMTLAGVYAYMPTTGERDDIGPMTASQGRYIVTGDSNDLAVLMTQAEAGGTVTWHMRDEVTGAPISFDEYPKVTWYYSQSAGSPVLNIPTPPPIDGNFLSPDTAHQPALSYLPYLLTGDLFYLEELQFQATWCHGSLPAQYRPPSKDALIDQSRSFAWTVRTLASVVKATPSNAPKYLLSKDYWQRRLDEYRTMFEDKYVNNTTQLVRSLFRACGSIDNSRDEGVNAPGGSWVDPWQDEFVASILGWMVYSGMEEWRKSFDWIIAGTKARTNGVSGWNRAYSTPYRMLLRRTPITRDAAGNVTTPTVGSWSDAWVLTSKIDPAIQAVKDPTTWVGDANYFSYTYGALQLANLIYPDSVTENLVWLSVQKVKRNFTIPEKWQIGK